MSKSKSHYDRQSVGQFVLVSCPSWSRWPDVTFIWVIITFFIFHVGRLLWGEDGSAICSAMTQVQFQVTLRPTVCRTVRLLQLIYDRQSVGQSVLVSGAHLGPVKFLFLLEISFRQLCVCNFIAFSLTRGRVYKLMYSCFWALPEQSLLGRSPAELTAIFNCLIWDSINLEGQVPVFRSHISAVRNFQCYHWEGCMRSMQCNVEFGYQLSICSGTKEKNEWRIKKTKNKQKIRDVVFSSI
jgi:hypothetical protein